MRILHLAYAADWAAALTVGRYEVSTRGARLDQVGFIHCSTPDQLAEVAELVYADAQEDLVVLALDDAAVQAAGTDVRYEDGGNGKHYPHIYGPLNTAWVQEVRPASFDGRGKLHWDG
jgi:uncharacterized protein (DUF952 family)